MSSGYAPLPNPRSEPEAERELEAAFDEDDDHDHSESTPLTYRLPPTDSRSPDAPAAPAPTPGSYDFERDYDYDRPPPGSPPSPSVFALPNEIGNSNGQLPVDAAVIRPEPSRPSFFRRAVGVLLPQHYARIPTEPGASAGPARGGGIENDGVFANVMAKPGRQVAVTNENGDVIMIPEDTQNEMPPSYREAQADSVPPYWETTVHAPAVLGAAPGDMIIDDLPTGSFVFFLVTAFTSYFFQFIGFIVTYILCTTHAAKYGSRAGLGMTMIQYGFYSRNRVIQEEEDGTSGQGSEVIYWNVTSGQPIVISQTGDLPNGTYVDMPGDGILSGRDWMSFLMIFIGWLLLLSSLVGFYRVKRWEKSIRAASAQPEAPGYPQRQYDNEVRRRFERLMGMYRNESNQRRTEPITPPPEFHHQLTEEEERLHNDLREAGLL